MRMLEGGRVETFVRALENRGAKGLRRVEPSVRHIVGDVRERGDVALRDWARRLDGLQPDQPMAVSPDAMRQAWQAASTAFRKALRTAAGNIRRFCELQKPQEWRKEISPGIWVGQIVRPLASVGCYVPGGQHPLPSTLLMTVIPAQIAGVADIRVVTPKPAPETLAAAAFLGVDQLYSIGGAHAIGALAYGTESIARVDKIVGPGNVYVTAAKRLVALDCSIDMLAGPTEVVILANSGNADFIAADLVAQAEHAPDATAVMVTTSRILANAVAREVERRLWHSREGRRNRLPRRALQKNGAILLVSSAEEAVRVVNRIAPEHLTLTRNHLAAIRNAGSIFLGEWSPQAAGDYASGPNHVLPTGGAARLRGGLSVMDFVKLISVQELSSSGLCSLAPTITTLAHAEGLSAHAQSIRVRCGCA